MLDSTVTKNKKWTGSASYLTMSAFTVIMLTAQIKKEGITEIASIVFCHYKTAPPSLSLSKSVTVIHEEVPTSGKGRKM